MNEASFLHLHGHARDNQKIRALCVPVAPWVDAAQKGWSADTYRLVAHQETSPGSCLVSLHELVFLADEALTHLTGFVTGIGPFRPTRPSDDRVERASAPSAQKTRRAPLAAFAIRAIAAAAR